MPPTGICINCDKPATGFHNMLCEECKAIELEKTLDEALARNKKMAKRTQRKLRIQDKIMKACTVIVVICFAILAYGVIFT